MGVGASITDEEHQREDEKHFEIFQQVSKIYHEDFEPKIASGQFTEKQAFLAAKYKFQELMRVKLESQLFRKTEDVLQTGDIVRVYDSGRYREGVIFDMISDKNVMVDFGDNTGSFAVANCKLILKGEDFEIGDKVEMQIPDTALYCLGEILIVNHDGTMDIKMDGDDAEDIERSVRRTSVRKVMTKRSLARDRWRRASLIVVASNAFLKQIDMMKKDTSQSTTNNINNLNLDPYSSSNVGIIGGSLRLDRNKK
jgi:hypothetical protein